ncbi:sigma-70 family RNA polymerase sigma factor [Robbsia sp. KACC 23696]|uniref:RNA polymerase sigma factor n=1 Tax=Robbsia sp. KACC 23696 TaxID=3149231 RepID=UPI00325BEE0E
MNHTICSPDLFHYSASMPAVPPPLLPEALLIDSADPEAGCSVDDDFHVEIDAAHLLPVATPAWTETEPLAAAAVAHTMPFTGYVDENALFRELIDKHSSRLYRFILKHIGNASDAEELAQQTFVEAVQAYRTFRGDSQLSTWLYGIAMNLVRNYLSRAPHRRHHMTDDSILDDMPESDIAGRTVHDPEQRFAQTQLFAQMDVALAELPEHMRELLILVGVEALSYEEAAVMLTIPIGTVRSRLSRARKALSEKLAARGIVP